MPEKCIPYQEFTDLHSNFFISIAVMQHHLIVQCIHVHVHVSAVNTVHTVACTCLSVGGLHCRSPGDRDSEGEAAVR